MQDPVHIVIPRDILNEPKPSSTGKLIFGLVFTSCLKNQSESTTEWGVKSLAQTLGQSRQNIILQMKVLKKLKLLNWVVTRGKNNEKNGKQQTIVNFTLGGDQSKVFSMKSAKRYININTTNEVSSININNIIRQTSEGSLQSAFSPNQGESIGQRLRTKQKHQPKRSATKPSGRRDRLLDKIFQMQNVPCHRPGTVIYDTSAWTLRRLRAGRLFENANVDAAWMGQFSIPEKSLRQCWPDFQILRVFEDVAKAYTLGYEPKDKSTLPSNFPDILLNPRSNKSLFLKIAAKGISKLHRLTDGGKGDRLLPIEKNVLKILSAAVADCLRREPNQQEAQALIDAAKKLIMEYDNHIRFLDLWRTPLGFTEDYAEWIRGNHEGRLTDGRWFGPGTRDWKNYARKRGIER